MVTLGLLSVLFAAFMLYRRHDIKRMFAYSSIEHMGIITFAFGMGGPLANFAGLLHMTYHSLTKSAIFFSVGHIAQIKGTQRMADIRGLTVSHPVLGWGLVLGVITIVGLPPTGIFMTEFLIVTSTFARQPVLAVVLALGLLVALGALLLRLNGLAFGEPVWQGRPVAGFVRADVRASGAGGCGRDLSAVGAGRLVPARRDFARVAAMTDPAPAHRRRPGRARRTGRGRVRWSAKTAGSRRSSLLQAGQCTLLGLWGEQQFVHVALIDADGREPGILSLPCEEQRFPSIGRLHAPAIRLERSLRDLSGLEPVGSHRYARLAGPRQVAAPASAGTHGSSFGARQPRALCVSAGRRGEPA